ncbi:hypothetical protein Avbf_09286 [Armadillidium vulgare]|nr:hypothetical protein Avbf_09286 [Armadillidium vulgare]
MAEALEFRCDLCGRGFASLKGLRVHQQRAHRPEYNQRLLDQRGETKTRWSAEEVVLLAEKELDLERRNVTFMNMALAPLFPARTLETIKGKQASYREILGRSSSASAESGARSAHGDAPWARAGNCWISSSEICPST